MRAVLQVGRELAATASRLDADVDRDAGRSQPSDARRPATLGSGSSMPTTTRATPASINASAHGGVRPWCEHGSRVVNTVAPRAAAPAAIQGHGLGVGTARRLGRAVERRPVGGDDDTADPRVGRGRGRGRRRRARSPAHRCRCRPCLLLVERRTRARRCHARTLAPIRTLTVGSGVPPDRPGPGRDGFADSHRRSGLAPTTPRGGVCFESLSFVRRSLPAPRPGRGKSDRMLPHRSTTPVRTGPCQWGWLAGQQARAWGTTSSTASRHSTAPVGDPGGSGRAPCPTCRRSARDRRPSGFTSRMASARPGASRSSDGPGALRGEVTGAEAGAAGGDDQPGEARSPLEPDGLGHRVDPVGHDALVDHGEPGAGESLRRAPARPGPRGCRRRRRRTRRCIRASERRDRSPPGYRAATAAPRSAVRSRQRNSAMPSVPAACGSSERTAAERLPRRARRVETARGPDARRRGGRRRRASRPR